MTAGERIKERRIELGMTQEELATKLGYKSRSSVNKVELAEDLTLKTVRMYAKALNVDPAYIMGFDSLIEKRKGKDVLRQEMEERMLYYMSKLSSAKQELAIDLVKRIAEDEDNHEK